VGASRASGPGAGAAGACCSRFPMKIVVSLVLAALTCICGAKARGRQQRMMRGEPTDPHLLGKLLVRLGPVLGARAASLVGDLFFFSFFLVVGVLGDLFVLVDDRQQLRISTARARRRQVPSLRVLPASFLPALPAGAPAQISHFSGILLFLARLSGYTLVPFWPALLVMWVLRPGLGSGGRRRRRKG
jgi:hypothetical protein